MAQFKIVYNNPKRKEFTETFMSGLVPAKEFAEMLGEKGWLITFKQIEEKERDYTHLIRINRPHV